MKYKDIFNLRACLNHSDEIDSICAPLKILRITYFYYMKIFDSGQRVVLTNRPSWVDFFYCKSLNSHESIVELERNTKHGEGIYPWSMSESSPLIIAREDYNIDNGVTISEHGEKFREFYCFAGEKSDFQLSLFMNNNIDLLQRFILFFKNRSAPIIEKIEKNKFTGSEKLKSHTDYKPITCENINHFMNDTNIERFHLARSDRLERLRFGSNR